MGLAKHAPVQPGSTDSVGGEHALVSRHTTSSLQASVRAWEEREAVSIAVEREASLRGAMGAKVVRGIGLRRERFERLPLWLPSGAFGLEGARRLRTRLQRGARARRVRGCPLLRRAHPRPLRGFGVRES